MHKHLLFSNHPLTDYPALSSRVNLLLRNSVKEDVSADANSSKTLQEYVKADIANYRNVVMHGKEMSRLHD